jgi:hypothetical protein
MSKQIETTASLRTMDGPSPQWRGWFGGRGSQIFTIMVMSIQDAGFNRVTLYRPRYQDIGTVSSARGGA